MSAHAQPEKIRLGLGAVRFYFDFPLHNFARGILQVHLFTPLDHLPVVQFDFLVLQLVRIVLQEPIVKLAKLVDSFFLSSASHTPLDVALLSGIGHTFIQVCGVHIKSAYGRCDRIFLVAPNQLFASNILCPFPCN